MESLPIGSPFSVAAGFHAQSSEAMKLLKVTHQGYVTYLWSTIPLGRKQESPWAALALGQAHLRDVGAAGGNAQLFESRKNESVARSL